MIKGFRDFLMRGNIVELAIAVVIGTAFTALVGVFTKSIIDPVIARAGGGASLGFGVQLGAAGNTNTFVDFGAVINALITFAITAAVVYFIFVVPMEKLAALRRRGDVVAAVPLTEAELLLQIRDLLAERSS